MHKSLCPQLLQQAVEKRNEIIAKLSHKLQEALTSRDEVQLEAQSLAGQIQALQKQLQQVSASEWMELFYLPSEAPCRCFPSVSYRPVWSSCGLKVTRGRKPLVSQSILLAFLPKRQTSDIKRRHQRDQDMQVTAPSRASKASTLAATYRRTPFYTN